MNSLDLALNEYIAIRRALGFELREVAGCLRNFVAFLKIEGASYITRELALRWATQPADAQPYTWAWRLGMVRRFAAWHSATEPRTEIPAPGLLPHRYQRKTPHIYSDEEIASLLRRAEQLPSAKGLRAPTYTTLFGLLAVTGMRVNEALHLDKPDVDLDQGILTIRRTKFGKSRHVPVHSSTVGRLKEYAEKRDRVVRTPPSQAFFLSERGTRITEWMARYTFAKLSQQLGFRRKAKGHGRGPRLHDMRHRFAAHTLVRWYREGLEVERELPKLATYLGHVHINETYWYLEAVPELLQLATDRLLDNGKEARR
jgi:integrase/recombinase XerD